MNEILNYFVALVGIVLLIFAVVTFLVARRDKYFALALMLCEIAVFVGVSTFGQVPLTKLVLTVAGTQSSIEFIPGESPDYFYATVVLLGCGAIAVMFMALRTWDRRTSG